MDSALTALLNLVQTNTGLLSYVSSFFSSTMVAQARTPFRVVVVG